VTPIERFDIEASNVQMANNVYRSAYDAGAQRVVMASSNHAANWYEHALVNDKRMGDGVAPSWYLCPVISTVGQRLHTSTWVTRMQPVYLDVNWRSRRSESGRPEMCLAHDTKMNRPVKRPAVRGSRSSSETLAHI